MMGLRDMQGLDGEEGAEEGREEEGDEWTMVGFSDVERMEGGREGRREGGRGSGQS